jgi:hypothetical protein
MDRSSRITAINEAARKADAGRVEERSSASVDQLAGRLKKVQVTFKKSEATRKKD